MSGDIKHSLPGAANTRHNTLLKGVPAPDPACSSQDGTISDEVARNPVTTCGLQKPACMHHAHAGLSSLDSSCLATHESLQCSACTNTHHSDRLSHIPNLPSPGEWPAPALVCAHPGQAVLLVVPHTAWLSLRNDKATPKKSPPSTGPCSHPQCGLAAETSCGDVPAPHHAGPAHHHVPRCQVPACGPLETKTPFVLLKPLLGETARLHSEIPILVIYLLHIIPRKWCDLPEPWPVPHVYVRVKHTIALWLHAHHDAANGCQQTNMLFAMHRC